MTFSNFQDFSAFHEPISSQFFYLTPKLLFLLTATPDLSAGIFTNFSHERKKKINLATRMMHNTFKKILNPCLTIVVYFNFQPQ